MLRRILRRLRARFETGAEDDNGDDRFVPSELDASVRYAHGGSRETVEGELGDVVEQAAQLENADREREN